MHSRSSAQPVESVETEPSRAMRRIVPDSAVSTTNTVPSAATSTSYGSLKTGATSPRRCSFAVVADALRRGFDDVEGAVAGNVDAARLAGADQRRRRVSLRVDAQHAAVAGVADQHRAVGRDGDAVRPTEAGREHASADLEGPRRRGVEDAAVRRDRDRPDLRAARRARSRARTCRRIAGANSRSRGRSSRSASSRPRTASRARTRRWSRAPSPAARGRRARRRSRRRGATRPAARRWRSAT